MAIKKNRAALNEERNKKIKDMDMEEVKSYLCMKHNQNPDKCEGCLGLSTCTAGQRVMVLKAEQEKRKAEEQKAEEQKEAAPKKKRNYNTSRSERARAYVKQVLAAENPSEYLMQNEGITHKQVLKKLENWRGRYRDLFEDAKPKTQHEKNANMVSEYNDERRVQFETACQQEQMIQWMMGQTGMDRQQARSRMRYLAGIFPDVAEKYHFNQKYEAETNWSMVHITPEEKEQKMESNDVSVEDFLNAINPEKDSSPNIVETVDTGLGNESVPDGIDDFRKKLEAKFNELENERVRINAEIDRLRDQCALIEKAKDALSMTLNVFNPDSVIGKAIRKGD